LLDEWADIDARERALSIERGTPILVDPRAHLDPRLAEFFRRSRFATLAASSKESYAKDYRLLFAFLWRRGKHWDEADADDVDDYEAWRRRSEDNPSRISGAKWARELAAFKLLYVWMARRRYVASSPVLTHAVRGRDGELVEVAANRPKDVRSSNVKWLTPRTFRLWRDVGLRGYTAAGLPDESWRGRNSGRNAAFADLLFDSGLRLREGGCLLTIEVPHALAGQSYYEGTVAQSIAKKRERMFYVGADALAGVTTYMAVARRAAIRRAQRAGRYDEVRGRRVATGISRGLDRWVTWEDVLGREGTTAVRALTARERATLFIQGDTGLEPLWLWLGENGLPMDYCSWEAVFGAANDRCAAQGKPIYCTPHMCRHSFALKMLVTLGRALDRRYGRDTAERDYVRKVYGEAFELVQGLLGHKSEQTTRDVYLEPVNGLRLREILDGSEDLDMILSRVAESSRLVMDVDPGDDEDAA
jgi:site-specific recombinase XerD